MTDTSFKSQTLKFGKVILAASLSIVFSCQSLPSQAETSKTVEKAKNEKTPTKPSSWKYLNEQEWIVDSIGKDIAEILAYAKSKQDTEASKKISVEFQTKTTNLKKGQYTFNFTNASAEKPLNYSFTLREYVWGPVNYVPFAEKILESFDLKAAPSSEAPKDFVKNLATAEMPTLFSENERISKALSENPLDAGLHEQAALLQATYAMLELAGLFSDYRSSLERIATHLTIARALSKNNLSFAGQTADIALEAMTCRDGVALKLIDAMDQAKLDSTEKSFLRALKIRASGDFRLFDQKDHTTLEANQYALRYAPAMGNEKVLQFIRQNYPDGKIIWFRTLMSHGLSVGMGHMIATKAVQMEMHDYIKNYQFYKEKNVANAVAVAFELNSQPTRCLTTEDNGTRLNVISWDSVAATHARNILWAIYTEWMFYAHMLGVKETSQAKLAEEEKIFGFLDLFPVATIFAELTPEKKQQVFASMQLLIEKHPERVSDMEWLAVNKGSEKTPSKTPLTPPNAWFDPILPMGTAYNFSARKDLTGAAFTVDELAALHQLCPNDEQLSKEYAKKKYGENPTQEQLEEAFGKQLNTNIRLMRATAETNLKDPEKFIPIYLKICELEPADYFQLAAYCVHKNRTEDAAKYYEMGMEHDTDDVGKANQTYWLMNYYYSKGDKEKAKALATYGAEVYSFRGLHTFASYYELEKDLKNAEEQYIKIKERYDDKGVLAAFYVRNAKKDKRYETEGEKMQAAIFPSGLKKRTLADYKSAPTKGMRITYEDKLSENHDLARNSIVVAVNGIEIDNKPQAFFLENLSTDPYLTFIVWDGKKYLETKTLAIQNRTPDVSFETFKEKEKP